MIWGLLNQFLYHIIDKYIKNIDKLHKIVKILIFYATASLYVRKHRSRASLWSTIFSG